MHLVRRDSDALSCSAQGIIENSDPAQVANIFLENAKCFRMRLKPENPGIGELVLKINNRRTDIAADIDDRSRFERRRHIIFRFRAGPEQDLIDSKRIAGPGSIKDVLTEPTQPAK